MIWFITNLVAYFLLPPLSLLLLVTLGIIMLYRGHRFAKPLIVTSCLLLWILSTPFVSEGALHLLERQTSVLDSSLQKTGAIVILGGGTYFSAPEYAYQDTIGQFTLERLRYGAKLQRETGIPVLVTGGNPLGNDLSEAQQMRSVLEHEFHISARWTEDTSENTFQNAYHSFTILQKEGVKKIFLVTHAWHMPRAAEVFRRAGFEVIEAPTAFTTRFRTDLLTFLPRAEAMYQSKIFTHELIGLLWYRLKLLITDD